MEVFWPVNNNYYYINEYTKRNRNLIGCSIINIWHIIPNIGCTAVPCRPIIFDIGLEAKDGIPAVAYFVDSI